MANLRSHSKAIIISAFSLPIGIFAVYVAYLIVPEILQEVVPTVVRSVVSQ
jgi:hypothetical protein